MKQPEQHKIRLCVDCFNCKKKNGMIYCKLGVWEETNKLDKSILYTPYDFSCPKWDEA